MVGGSWWEGPRWETGCWGAEQAWRKGEGCCLWWGGLQAIYSEGDLHFPMNVLCGCLKPQADCSASSLTLGMSYWGRCFVCWETAAWRSVTESYDRRRWTANLNQITEHVLRYDSSVVLNQTEVGVRHYLLYANRAISKGSEGASVKLGLEQGDKTSQTNVCV